MAVLYGTRLSFGELADAARTTFVPLGDETALRKELATRWLWDLDHARYRLKEAAEELTERMLPPNSTLEEEEVKPAFYRSKRSRPMYTLPKDMLEKLLLEDLDDNGWVTAYGEWVSLYQKLGELARTEGSIIWMHFAGRDVPRQDVTDALRPQAKLLRRILDGMAAEGRLEKRIWFREIGRPTTAYFLHGKAPFLESRCGQCAFYVPAKWRCRLWWLVNKRQVYFHPEWKEPDSKVTSFELHKMKEAGPQQEGYSSRM